MCSRTRKARGCLTSRPQVGGVLGAHASPALLQQLQLPHAQAAPPPTCPLTTPTHADMLCCDESLMAVSCERSDHLDHPAPAPQGEAGRPSPLRALRMHMWVRGWRVVCDPPPHRPRCTPAGPPAPAVVAPLPSPPTLSRSLLEELAEANAVVGGLPLPGGQCVRACEFAPPTPSLALTRHTREHARSAQCDLEGVAAVAHAVPPPTHTLPPAPPSTCVRRRAALCAGGPYLQGVCVCLRVCVHVPLRGERRSMRLARTPRSTHPNTIHPHQHHPPTHPNTTHPLTPTPPTHPPPGPPCHHGVPGACGGCGAGGLVLSAPAAAKPLGGWVGGSWCVRMCGCVLGWGGVGGEGARTGCRTPRPPARAAPPTHTVCQKHKTAIAHGYFLHHPDGSFVSVCVCMCVWLSWVRVRACVGVRGGGGGVGGCAVPHCPRAPHAHTHPSPPPARPPTRRPTHADHALRREGGGARVGVHHLHLPGCKGWGERGRGGE